MAKLESLFLQPGWAIWPDTLSGEFERQLSMKARISCEICKHADMNRAIEGLGGMIFERCWLKSGGRCDPSGWWKTISSRRGRPSTEIAHRESYAEQLRKDDSTPPAGHAQASEEIVTIDQATDFAMVEGATGQRARGERQTTRRAKLGATAFGGGMVCLLLYILGVELQQLMEMLGGVLDSMGPGHSGPGWRKEAPRRQPAFDGRLQGLSGKRRAARRRHVRGPRPA
ncbi:unnamed protein product [Prorocentrum cordatum]|uniref:Uncharacterized protein n=1 Tax=Prorocentrum cordatum TaxID=2364126 RepID=A0ABN9RE46_9DINO|nr:unnamed protein product [Polarella glacialis]